jgi:hypothetical protein
MGAKLWARKDGRETVGAKLSARNHRRERMGAFAFALEYWMPHAGCHVLKKRRNSSQMAIYNCFF